MHTQYLNFWVLLLESLCINFLADKIIFFVSFDTLFTSCNPRAMQPFAVHCSFSVAFEEGQRSLLTLCVKGWNVVNPLQYTAIYACVIQGLWDPWDETFADPS